MTSPADGILRLLGRWATRTSALNVLIFHRVLADADEACAFDIDAGTFDAILACVRKSFFVLPLQEALSSYRDGTLPARSLCITFDDGYRDNHEIALPILEKHGLRATFFVATAYLDGGCMWNDIVIHALCNTRASCVDLPEIGLRDLPLDPPGNRREKIHEVLGRIKYREVAERDELARAVAERCGTPVPRGLMMDTQQVASLHDRGMEIGGHTHTHPIMSVETEEFLSRDIERNRRILEDLTGTRLQSFAYPNGKPGKDYGPRDKRLVEEAGYESAVTTSEGTLFKKTFDPYQIPRFTPWDRSCGKFTVRIALNSRRHPALVR